MQKVIILIALCVFAASASEFDLTSTLWNAWKVQHNRFFSTHEEASRFNIFSDNVDKISKFNAENNGVKLALNKFADLTAEEFKAQYASGGLFEPNTRMVERHTKQVIKGGLPDEVDWRNKGAVTPVKDQGQCGSCWSFSTTGVIEGFHFTQTGELLSFAEQQIVDCDRSTNQGCNGGWPYLAVQYAAQNGLELESDYPYTARDGSCNFNAGKAHKVNSGYAFVPAKSTDQLKNALVNGPVSVLIEADQQVFQFYSSGVIKAGCGASLDHAVLAVGYQKVGVLEAFIVKNSWGTSWGDSGYVYIWSDQQENQGQGVCGILAQPLAAN